MNTKELIGKLPPDFSKQATRDISVLSSSVFGESHGSMNKLFGASFTVTFWFAKETVFIRFYRAESEYLDFSRRVAKRCLNERYAKKLADQLIRMTDWLNEYIQKSKTIGDLVKNRRVFFNQYRDFFSYHQAVYWGGDYLSKLSKKGKNDKAKQIIKILDAAYAYNQTIVPRLEKYFQKLKISHLLYDEVNDNVKQNIRFKETRRSLLFLKDYRIIYPYRQARFLEKLIEERYNRPDQKIREIKGLGVGTGLACGKVRSILNLNLLKSCRKNDILVTHMTRPQFNSYIKKVKAIITDEGGLLCHASILAREYKIPCVVGTKIATQVLHDGDLVRVNGNRGVVTVIKRN